MAALKFSLSIDHTPNANPRTLFQVVAPASQRLLLLGIELMPLGATAATAPIPFDVVRQTTAGTASSLSAVKTAPDAAESVQATAQQTFTAEPTLGESKFQFSLHQQGSRLWTPPSGAIVIAGGERWGLRYLSSTFVQVKVQAFFEE